MQRIKNLTLTSHQNLIFNTTGTQKQSSQKTLIFPLPSNASKNDLKMRSLGIVFRIFKH